MAVAKSDRQYNRPRKELEVKEEFNILIARKRRDERLKEERQREEKLRA